MQRERERVRISYSWVWLIPRVCAIYSNITPVVVVLQDMACNLGVVITLVTMTYVGLKTTVIQSTLVRHDHVWSLTSDSAHELAYCVLNGSLKSTNYVTCVIASHDASVYAVTIRWSSGDVLTFDPRLLMHCVVSFLTMKS